MANSSYYRAVIKCDADGDGKDEYYEMDVIQPVNENLSTQITEHPLIEGGMLGDHMYVNPMTIQLTGKFSTVGSKLSAYDGPNARLANIQRLFEKIMKEGIFCSIVHLAKNQAGYDGSSNVHFVQRDNMVLNNISWTEQTNTLSASLGFREVQTAKVDEVLYEVDDRDPNLPALTEPQTLDFTDNFLDWSKVDEMVIKMCYDCDIIDEGFLEVLVTINTVVVTTEIIAGIAALVTAGIIVNAVISGALTASTAIFPVGTILAGVAAIAFGIAALFSWFNQLANAKKYKVQQFRKYNSDRENQAEVERFQNFIGSIHQQIEMLENVISVYSITSNQAQECMLYIDDEYYIFVFERNNVTNTWSLKVKNINDELVDEMPQLTGLASIDECTSSNYRFRTKGVGSYVYIMNSKQQELALNGASQSEIDTANNDLTNYSILISKMNLDDFTQALQDIIKNALEA